MKRFINPVPQFMKLNGDLCSSGKLYFYESGSTTTKKAIYIDSQGADESVNPVPLSGEGRVPEIYGDGIYTVVLKDSAGVEQWRRDDVNFSADISQYGEWSSAQNYNLNSIVESGGNFYKSDKNQNKGNLPALDSEWWSQIAFFDYWNASKSGGYSAGEITIYAGKIYSSKGDDNTFIPTNLTYWNALTFNGTVDSDLTVNGKITATDRGQAVRKASWSIVSTTTLAQDTSLTISGLTTGWYQVSGILQWNDNGGGAANKIKLSLNAPPSVTTANYVWENVGSAANTAVEQNPNSTVTFQAPISSSSCVIKFNALVRLDSGSEIYLMAAQGVSSATTTSLQRGSMTAIKVGTL